MPFDSILHTAEEVAQAPECFRDLNLDQILAAILDGNEEYDLAPIFHSPLRTEEAVVQRQQVFRDLEKPAVANAIRAFADLMRSVRSSLKTIEKLSNPHQIGLWFLHALTAYCEAAMSLAEQLSPAVSPGLRSFRDYLAAHIASSEFRQLYQPARSLLDEVAAIRYVVAIIGLRVEVRPYRGEADYSEQITSTFARFAEGEVARTLFEHRDTLDMSQVELQILDGAAYLHSDLFARIAAHKHANANFLNPTLMRFDREIQFYLAYIDYVGSMGLEFCYPHVSQREKTVFARNTFDLALARKLMAEDAKPVVNDFELSDGDRIIVVSGPNQGGKTTFARTFGQLHYLAALGCPVPGCEASLFLPDQILTHFERQERAANLRGKLEDDLLRIHAILAQATSQSLLVVNEIFASTSMHDASILSEQIADAIAELDAVCVWVTFLEELARRPRAVSYVSTVLPEDPALRTFKVVKRPPDGLAYAMSIAEKYRLTYTSVKERVRS